MSDSTSAEKTADPPRREGPFEAPAGTSAVEVAHGSIRLRLAVGEDHVIRVARYDGTDDPGFRAVLEALCREVEGLLVQEATDHGAIRTMHALNGRDKARHVPGIALPRNAGPAFAMIEALLRDFRRRYDGMRGLSMTPNEYTSPPAASWQELDHDARLARLKAAVAAYLQEQHLGMDDVRVVKIESDLTGAEVRLDIGFGEQVGPAAKPALARALERWLKRAVEDKLQVYMEPLKDKNAIRRL